MADVSTVIDFLKKSSYPIFRAMGGEPTLHPRFADIVRLALQEGLRIDLLSNATWRDELNELFVRIAPSRLLFLLNVDHPDEYVPSMWSRIERNLMAIAGRSGITLSFNMFQKQPRHRYIFDLATRFGIRTVRLSFSLPVLAASNAHLDIHEYREMVPFILAFVREAEAKGLTVHLDNAVPLCIFSYEQAGELLLKGTLDLKRNARCEPIVDIGPDLTVWSCFCLSKLYNKHLTDFTNLREIQRYYVDALRPFQDEMFPMDECYDCEYRRLWNCQGGCTTFSITNGGDRAQDLPVATKGVFLKQRLTVPDGVAVKRYDIPEDTFFLRNNVSGAELELKAEFKPLLELFDGQHAVEEVVSKFLCRNENRPNQNAIDNFERDLIEEALHDLTDSLLRQGFLCTTSTVNTKDPGTPLQAYGRPRASERMLHG